MAYKFFEAREKAVNKNMEAIKDAEKNLRKYSKEELEEMAFSYRLSTSELSKRELRFDIAVAMVTGYCNY